MTDLNRAFEVVEKMDDCLHLKQHNKNGLWEAHFCVADVTAEADTPEMAICLAAEKAIEVKP